MTVEHCAFCGCDLSVDDMKSQSNIAVWLHCRVHANHASYPQLWLLKKELGVAYEEPLQEERICAVCGLPLSDEEMKLVEKTHVNLVCSFHKRAVRDFNIHLTRQKLGYSEYREKPIDLMIKNWNLKK